MSLKLQIFVLIIAISIIFYTLAMLMKNKIIIKYSLVWFFSGGILIILVMFPQIMKVCAELLGFQLVSNMIFFVAICLLGFINLSLTIIVSKQNKRINVLIQEVSILKEENKG